jgi:hypothetical protein
MHVVKIASSAGCSAGNGSNAERERRVKGVPEKVLEIFGRSYFTDVK